tara:strand:- start:286 stop:495 length:210 start_codon:yes stop_codon:yes gene_type:complete
MSTTTEVNVHFEMLLQAIHDAHRDVSEYVRDASNWTDVAKTAQRLKITNVRPDLIHPSNCTVCTGWTEE